MRSDQGRGGGRTGISRRRFTGGAVAAVASAGVIQAQEAALIAPPRRPAATGPLAEYVHAADAATGFEPLGEGELFGGEWLTGRFTSQRWRGGEWRHELSLFRPKLLAGSRMLLFIGGGTAGMVPDGRVERPSPALETIGQLAGRAGLPAAYIGQVPFQPLCGGLVEDALIAHSFLEFVKTGDTTWPLLLPMAKAAVEAMTAAEAAARNRWDVTVDGFVVTGASKRGWTTWLTAALDDRVAGFVPAVIDMLNMERHLGLQREAYGGLSDKLVDYSSRGMEQVLGSPRGRELVEIVDPFAYRDRLVQPKIIALGTNDPYWPLEASRLYFGDLEGPSWLAYGANETHSLLSDRLYGLIVAMGWHAAGFESLPAVDWSIEAAERGAVVRSRSPAVDGLRAVAWRAESASRDFRGSRWRASDAERDGDGWRLDLEAPANGFVAGFLDLEFPRQPVPLRLSSGIEVVGSA